MEAMDRSTGVSNVVRFERAAPRVPGAAIRRPRTLSPLAATARRVVVASIALLVTACSSVKLGYDNADTLLLFALDSYLDLDDAQQRLARERTRELLAWHRATQLPEYAQFLRDAEKRLRGQVTADEMLALYLRANRALLALGEHAAPDLARLALTLKPVQIEHLERKLAENTSKARRELAGLAGRESLDDRVQRYAERAASWFGELTPAQIDIVRRNLVARPSNQAWWVAERERRQHELVALLKRIESERPDVDTAAGWLRAHFARLAQPQDPEERARVLEFRTGNAELVAELVNSASVRQKSVLMGRLRGYAEDFTALAAAGSRG